MSLLERAEKSLAYHFDVLVTPQTPPRLVAAMRHAVFSSGARVRPQLCTAVALACSDDAPGLSDAMGSAIELMHCASLVHDDMPAFDNADTRRGQPTVHKAFGEPLALLTGDALIVLAYQVLAHAGAEQPQRLGALIRNLSAGVGVPSGIVNARLVEGHLDISDALAQWRPEELHQTAIHRLVRRDRSTVDGETDRAFAILLNVDGNVGGDADANRLRHEKLHALEIDADSEDGRLACRGGVRDSAGLLRGSRNERCSDRKRGSTLRYPIKPSYGHRARC